MGTDKKRRRHHSSRKKSGCLGVACVLQAFALLYSVGLCLYYAKVNGLLALDQPLFGGGGGSSSSEPCVLHHHSQQQHQPPRSPPLTRPAAAAAAAPRAMAQNLWWVNSSAVPRSPAVVPPSAQRKKPAQHAPAAAAAAPRPAAAAVVAGKPLTELAHPAGGASIRSGEAALKHYQVTKSQDSVFLVLAAFREKRCAKTIASAFEKALRPDDLYVGVFQQRSADDPDCTDFEPWCGASAPGRAAHPLCARTGQVAMRQVQWEDGEGPCVARAHAERLLDGQAYTFQIDAHSVFADKWDERLIAMWRQTGNEYAVLSAYPRSDSQINQKSYRTMPCICTTKLLDWSNRYMPKNEPGAMAMKDHPMLTAYWGAGFSFSKAHRILAVHNDPFYKYLFDGEEFDIAMRLFTHGYDIYAPQDTVIWHYYSSLETNKKEGIPKFWDYQWGKRFPIMFKSTRRMRTKIGIPAIMAQDPKIAECDLTDLDQYAPGDKRTVQQYMDWAGLDMLAGKGVQKGVCARINKGELEKVPWNL